MTTVPPVPVPTAAAPGRAISRTERTTQTRQRIIAAATDTFVAQGYRATSLRDIASAAEISHPGLLKHFRSKDELLVAVVATFEDRSVLGIERLLESEEGGTLGLSVMARLNAEIPGYLPLFAALTGEASTASHPAHEAMRVRYLRLTELLSDTFDEAAFHGLVAESRDSRSEAIRSTAAWDGLQVMAQYLPDRIDIVEALERHQAALAFPSGWAESDEPRPREAASARTEHVALAPVIDDESDDGYRVGRERRARILRDATTLFARDGYADTSLREIADRVGVSKSALLHYYPTKDALLSAVLTERDRWVDAQLAETAAVRATEVLHDLPRGAERNADIEPGLIELYAVLSCEAIPTDHPAHEYFLQRYEHALGIFVDLFRAAQADGDLPSHRDPEFEAIWFIALWDGLQYQWLYDRDAVDVAEHLAAHLDDVLPRR